MPKPYFDFQQSGEQADIYIFGDITSFPFVESDVSAYRRTRQLEQAGDLAEINVHVDSYGGEVAEEGRVEDIFAHPATDAARRLVYPGGVSAKQYPAGTRAVRVSFNGGTVYDPLIASLAIECGVKVNILGADTRNIDGKAFGTMLLLLPDNPNEAAKALSYIRSQPNITAEEVEYHA